MRLLDLFCGAGGSAVGYYRAGFTEIVGVDLALMPRYPFGFVQGDALEFLRSVKPGEYDLIHCSPPCQAYSVCRHTTCSDRVYPDLVGPTRDLLLQTGTPWVIENVVGAPLKDPVALCGVMFGLKVFRHRLFETSEFILQLPHPHHRSRRIGFDGFCCVAGHGDGGKRTRVDRYHRRKDAWQSAMGITWMTKPELTQAIPPAFTEWLGTQMISTLETP